MELIHGRGKIGGVLVDGVEAEFLVKLGRRRSERRPADLNVVVGKLARMGVRVLRRIAAEIRWKAKLSLPMVPNDADASVGDVAGAGDVTVAGATVCSLLVGAVGTVGGATSSWTAPDPSTIDESVRCMLPSTGATGVTLSDT